MPRRALGGNRRLIEAELGAAAVALLTRLCRHRRVPPERWLEVPDLAAVFTTEAVLSLAERLEGEGYGQTQARETASIRLGLEPSTIHSRLARTRQHALRLAA